MGALFLSLAKSEEGAEMSITVKITIEAGSNVRAEQEFPVYLPQESLSLTAQHAISAAAAKFGVHIPEFKQEGHQVGCICADCSGAELTSEND
jgi:hypothetical protein